MTGISQRAIDVPAQMLEAVLGRPALDLNAERVTAINATPQAKKQATLTVGTWTNDTDYKFTFDGQEYTYRSVTGDVDEAGVATKILALMKASPQIYGRVLPERSGAVITAVARWPGVDGDFTLSDTDAKITCADTVSSADAEAVGFGRLCVIGDYLSQDSVSPNNLKCFLPLASRFTAQVDSYVLTTTYESGVLAIFKVKIDGEEYTVEHAMASNVDTTGAAIAARFEAELPANTVSVTYTSGTDTLAFTAERPGSEFETSLGFGTGRTTAAIAKTSNVSASTSLVRGKFGIAEATFAEEGLSYPGNAGVTLLTKGRIPVELSATPTRGSYVYVETTSGATCGGLYNAASATRLRIPVSRAAWERSCGSGSGLAWLTLN